jgi:hypothetical protein
MANRSDFFSAKLPREYKRALATAEARGWVNGSVERGQLKRMFIEAHANHVGFKMKRHSTEHRDAADSE